jgi:CHAD domain-containing protein
LQTRWAKISSSLVAACEAPDEIEPVHQLRVASRRAEALLGILKSRLNHTEFRQARELVRAVRRSAGLARNSDVFLDWLDQSPVLAEKGNVALLNFLMGIALQERDQAQEILRDLREQREDELTQIGRKVPERIVSSTSTWDKTIRRKLHHALVKVMMAIESGLATPETLHDLRLALKQYRYLLELAHELLPDTQDLPALESPRGLQDCLGEIQDRAMMLHRLERIHNQVRTLRPHLVPRWRAGFTALSKELRQQLAQHRRKLQTQLSAWQTTIVSHIRETPAPLADASSSPKSYKIHTS